MSLTQIKEKQLEFWGCISPEARVPLSVWSLPRKLIDLGLCLY